MIWNAVALAMGMTIATATLLDVFATVVVPGRVGSSLAIPLLVRRLFFPVWRGVLRLLRHERRPTMGSLFGAAILLAMFFAWIGLLLLGFALIAWGLRHQFAPPLATFGDALFQVGSSMTTLGLSGETVSGFSRTIVVLSGVCGLLVITLTLTFIVQIQTALRDRDALVTKLAARAGSPPSGVRLLAVTRELDLAQGLPALFDAWESWSAVLLHSHAAHPVLAYFRSDEESSDWITSLGAVLDAASLVLAMLAEEPTGNARLMHEIGTKAARTLSAELELKLVQAPEINADAVALIRNRLRQAGYVLTPAEKAAAAFADYRGAYMPALLALSRHFGVDAPGLADQNELCPSA